MSRRAMNKQGRKIQRANEYRRNEYRRIAELCRHAERGTRPHDEQSGEAAPPVLLGGVKSQNINKMNAGERERSIGIDWIQGTIPFELMELFIDYISDIVGHMPESYNHGFSGYQTSCEWHPFGLKLAWDLDDRNRVNHANRVLFMVGGSGLGCFPPESLFKFCRDLCLKFNFKASRVDLCFDDFEKIIRPEEVYQYAEQRSYQGFRKHKLITGSGARGAKTDEGIYFGTRGKNGGGKFLRCYAKDIESEGEIDAIRWEVEFSKEKANKVFFKIAMSLTLEEFATHIALFIGGAIDFVERQGKRCDPLDRLAFWEQILHHLGAAKLRCPKEEGSIEQTKEWVEKSVVPSLEKMRLAVGDDVYYSWLRDQMEGVELRERAVSQVNAYHRVHGIPQMIEVPF